MSLLKSIFSFIKNTSIIILIIGIAIPFVYQSIDPKYLRVRCLHFILSTTYRFLPDQDRPHLSPEYRSFETILRLKPLVELDPLADPISVIKEVRSSFTLGIIIPTPSTCQVTKQVYQYEGHSVDAYWINHQPIDVKSSKGMNIVLYFHGGAYMAGDIKSYSGFECHLSNLFNVTVVHLEYRLAPEHPLPSAVDDALTLYKAVIYDDKVSPSKIIVMGDSAGGGLSLLIIQQLILNHLPIPRAVVALSPWADLSASGQSYVRNRLTDAMIRHEALSWGIQQVLGDKHAGKARDDPMFSPLFGSFSGFPPMYVNVGTAELLEDDSRQVVEKARQVGVNVTFEEGRDLAHVYPLFFPYFPESRMSLENIRKWIENQYQQ